VILDDLDHEIIVLPVMDRLYEQALAETAGATAERIELLDAHQYPLREIAGNASLVGNLSERWLVQVPEW